jgi:hypothetical protein
MSVSWHKHYDPKPVIEKIEASRKIGADGKFTFEGWAFREHVNLLYSMLAFSTDIPEIYARRFVTDALFRIGAKEKITARKLLATINRLEQQYHSAPTQRYVLASSISISPISKLDKINLGNSIIIFEPSLPPRFRREAEGLLAHAKKSIFGTLPSDYMGARVHVSAKSTQHAADKALEELELVRAIWNWAFNLRHISRRSLGGKPQPVNKFILGPLHTLHFLSGELATNSNWWYEPSYLEPVKPIHPTQAEQESMSRSLELLKDTLRRHKYSQDIRKTLIRYSRALDERNWATAFLKLWSVLEFMTDSTRASSDVAIRRTAFLFEERDYHLQILQHLREHRNAFVHLDKENSEIEAYLYEIKGYVERLLVFHFHNTFGFESLEEAAGFLGLPHEDEVLSKQIERLTLARKFRGSV